MTLKELIPGLPNDLAIQCLIHVPFHQFSKFESVCTSWKHVFRLPEFQRRRKTAGLTQTLLVMAQTPPKTTSGGHGMTGITVYDLDSGCRHELPPFPGFDSGLPAFCQMVGVGMKLVVIGGCDPISWKILGSVFVYDFASLTWRRGADMPGGKRLFFGCASDSEQNVLVAGGHDDNKDALESALMYDVAKDEWTLLPDMAQDRDECTCLFQRGEFHVIGRYRTESQGRFGKSREVFEIATRRWRVQGDFLESAARPMTCVDGRFYMCREGGDVVVFGEDGWRMVAQPPPEMCNVSLLEAWQGKLLAIGCAARRKGEPFTCYTLHLKNKTWSKLNVEREYFGLVGHVRPTCTFEI